MSSSRGERALQLKSIQLRSALADHYELTINTRFPDAPQPLIASQRLAPMGMRDFVKLHASEFTQIVTGR